MIVSASFDNSDVGVCGKVVTFFLSLSYARTIPRHCVLFAMRKHVTALPPSSEGLHKVFCHSARIGICAEKLVPIHE